MKTYLLGAISVILLGLVAYVAYINTRLLETIDDQAHAIRQATLVVGDANKVVGQLTAENRALKELLADNATIEFTPVPGPVY